MVSFKNVSTLQVQSKSFIIWMAIRTDLSRSFGIARFVPQTSKDFVHATLEMTRLLRSKRLNFCSVIVVVVVVVFFAFIERRPRFGP